MEEQKAAQALDYPRCTSGGKDLADEEFGRSYYENTVYINFDSNSQMYSLFEGDLSIVRIITGLEIYAGHKIDLSSTLLIFDEVQEVPKALTALKYFNEDAPQYQIVCAGSLPGIALHEGASFPIGKVEFLDLFPLSFFEFITAMGKGQFVELLKRTISKWQAPFGRSMMICSSNIIMWEACRKRCRLSQMAETSTKSEKFSSVFFQPTSRIFPNMRQMKWRPASVCCRTVFPRS